MAQNAEKLRSDTHAETELVLDTNSDAYRFLKAARNFDKQKLHKGMSREDIRAAMFGKDKK